MSAPPFRIVRSTRFSRVGLPLLGLVMLGLALAPYWADRAGLRLLAEVFAYLALASLWNLLAGFAGLASIGQQAYVGLGAYLLFGLSMLAGLPPLATIPLAGLIAGIVAAPVALLIFRLRGAYFAIGTWVVAEVLRLLASQISPLGGGSGISLPVGIVTSIASDRQGREFTLYWLSLLLLLIVMAAIVALLRSRYGLALQSVRDNEIAAQSNGVDVWRIKLMVYCLCACGTAMLGALIFLQKLRISPDTAFSVNDWTAFVIFIVVIGGVGTIEGPVVGTIAFFALRQAFSDLGSIYLLMLGVVAIIIMMRAPQGLWGLVASRFGWKLFPLDRHVQFPASIANK
jgi:ABC-type branched-chain amino acid transport system, permease component